MTNKTQTFLKFQICHVSQSAVDKHILSSVSVPGAVLSLLHLLYRGCHHTYSWHNRGRWDSPQVWRCWAALQDVYLVNTSPKHKGTAVKTLWPARHYHVVSWTYWVLGIEQHNIWFLQAIWETSLTCTNRWTNAEVTAKWWLILFYETLNVLGSWNSNLLFHLSFAVPLHLGSHVKAD